MAAAGPSTSAEASSSVPAAAAAAAGSSSTPSASLLPPPPRATSILIIGMAGSGKSTFAGALADYRNRQTLEASKAGAAATEGGEAPSPAYCVNLDPAVGEEGLNYEPNVDVRDTVDYHRVMEEYNLGPNGGILTSLNLFTTKFDQVLSILERRANEVSEIILDTPGQIEIFTWSASGTIITDALASAMPTCVAYVIDTPRTTAPATFMSNMLYACSIMYKTRLPFILVFNKTDVQPHQFAVEWMKDFEAFQRALTEGNATDPAASVSVQGKGKPGQGTRLEDGSYMNSLMNSMALVLDEFYSNLRSVGVSSATGEGLPAFFEAVQDARKEYMDEYRPELERMMRRKEEIKERRKKDELEKLMRDMGVGGKGKAGGQTRAAAEDEEEEIEEEYEGDGQIIDPDTDEERGDDEPWPGMPAERFDDGAAWPKPA